MNDLILHTFSVTLQTPASGPTTNAENQEQFESALLKKFDQLTPAPAIAPVPVVPNHNLSNMPVNPPASSDKIPSVTTALGDQSAPTLPLKKLLITPQGHDMQVWTSHELKRDGLA